MNIPDFTQLDAEILKSITEFPGGNFTDIYAGRVAIEASKIDPMRADKISFRRIRHLESVGSIYQFKRGWYPK